MWALPWMSWIAKNGPAVVNENVSLPAMLSGGSSASWSVTCEAKTVTEAPIRC